MSLPPELRILCFQLSNTLSSDLPRLTPTLLRHISRCHVALSSPGGNASKADASASSVQVQVHKLKTQISTLLNGKSPEGRFTAVVLIKAIIEAGGWEVLRGSEPWVRGLLSVLGKPDSAATKELCIVALTKIYCMTHPYQTLVREITTPTLPAFVTSCLNLLSSKLSRSQDVPISTAEIVYRSFATLLPRHTTIYRPFVSQIRAVAKPYLASTSSDGTFVPVSLAESARYLVVLLHQTAAKNVGGEEWGKAVRDLVKDIHVTADRVFRAVVEDWESAAGYIAEPVNVNAELSGGARNADDLPPWTGIDAGVERMVGLLSLLKEYFRVETSLPVSIPLGAIVDMITRILCIPIPSISQSGQGAARLHPAIDRDERDGLWSGMPQMYVAALKVVSSMADRLQDGFIPMAQGFLDQLAWVFPYGKHDSDFRLAAYCLAKQLLLQTGRTLAKPSSSKASVMIKSCCNDLIPMDANSVNVGPDLVAKKSHGNSSNANQNADTFLHNSMDMPREITLDEIDLVVAAKELLPLFMSHFPQKYLDISSRSLIERTSILSHSKDAMLAAILNPFVGKNGKSMTSILPHLARRFPGEDIVEILLRPRMPLVPSVGARLPTEEDAAQEDEDEDMEMDTNQHIDQHAFADRPLENTFDINKSDYHDDTSYSDTVMTHPGLGSSKLSQPATAAPHSSFGPTSSDQIQKQSKAHEPVEQGTLLPPSDAPLSHPFLPIEARRATEDTLAGTRMEENISDSDDDSVHLTMQLDTDSESDG